MDMLAKLFGGDIMTIFNPMYPLKFERFGDGDPGKDPEFEAHVSDLRGAGNPVSSELTAMANSYGSKRICKAEEKARFAYSCKEPVKEARAALAISPFCPEAYNVMAQCGAESYEQALEFYNKAVEVAPKICPSFAKDVGEGKCWSQNHLRSYFRAIHGQANTLRKMGRNKEALKKYLLLEKLDNDFHSWSSYANWRYHVLEVYMKLGDDKGAIAFASKKSNEQAFGLASSACAWLWTFALLEYRYRHRRGFASEYYRNMEQMSALMLPPVGAIMSAAQVSLHVLSFLTGERQLSNCKIPYVMKSESSLSNAAIYCMSNLELWKSTPGAIEWAAKNCYTHYCFIMLRKEMEILEFLKLKPTLENFKMYVKKGIFLEAELPGFGERLLSEAVKADSVDYLEVLLKAGAKVEPDLSCRIPQPLHIACYYDYSPNIIQMLCKYGANPSAKYGLHYSPIEMAAEQGAVRALKTALSCLPGNTRDKESIMNNVLFVLFCTSCYDCIMGKGPSCQRCSHDSNAHPKNASFTGCVNAVMETGYVPSKKILIQLHQLHSFKPELFDYILQRACKTSPSLKPLTQLTSNEAWQRMCSTCCEGNIKTMMCSGCHNIRYCSKKCQKADWKIHKKICYFI